jgi:hypothetical protein
MQPFYYHRPSTVISANGIGACWLGMAKPTEKRLCVNVNAEPFFVACNHYELMAMAFPV